MNNIDYIGRDVDILKTTCDSEDVKVFTPISDYKITDAVIEDTID